MALLCRSMPLWAALCVMPFTSVALALESDRQQPLELNAEGSEGSLGDGISVFRGRVEIRQGSLHIMADQAEVLKSEGRVARVTFTGQPAQLEQEIEAQGLVQAEANTITYEVSAGKVELAGAADVNHPQYRISGELLTYDLDTQHFEGTGANSEDGRISIRLEPEVAGALQGEGPSNGEEGPESDPESEPKNDADNDLENDLDRGPENDPPGEGS
jgi:lipopolysaccharide export system protein LptA